MTAVAVSVASRDCKSPGCAGEAMHARGPYAGLCLACTAIQRRRLSVANRAAAAKMTPEQRSARAIALVVLAVVTNAQLEKAIAAEEKAVQAARAARAARAAALGRVVELRRELDGALGIVSGPAVEASS